MMSSKCAALTAASAPVMSAAVLNRDNFFSWDDRQAPGPRSDTLTALGRRSSCRAAGPDLGTFRLYKDDIPNRSIKVNKYNQTIAYLANRSECLAERGLAYAVTVCFIVLERDGVKFITLQTVTGRMP